MASVNKIIPNLWFDGQAEDAARFYTSIFKNARLGRMTYYGRDGHEIHGQQEGTVMTVEFQLEGQDFVGINGGPQFKFNEAISLLVNCKDQKEVDYFWEALSKDGDPAAQQCGWLKDKYGVSWQIVPEALTEMVSDADTERAQRVLNVMYPMKKLDLAALEAAYRG